MKRMTIPAILVAAVLAFALAGCSSSSGQNMDEATMKGIWSLDTASSDLGFDAYVKLDEGSAAEMILADSYLDGTWSVSGADGSMKLDDRTVKMSYVNNKLVLGKSDGSVLMFVKDDSEKAKAVFEEDAGLISPDGYEVEQVEYVEEVITPVDPVVIADDDKVTITVTGRGTDYTGDPGYQMTIVNKMNRPIFVWGDEDFKVGDKVIEAGLGDELEIGETLETFMYFDQEELGGQLDKLTTTTGTIIVSDDETDEDYATYSFRYE